MLRPATPLTVLLLVSFVLLLLSVISTPVVKGIPLATFQDVTFGVFGYCKGSKCSGIRIGYNSDGAFGDSNNDGDFNLPSSARHSLSSLLVVHPVAAFLNLVCLALAGAAHLHSPSHSARYLLGLLILLLPTLLVTLLAFLVDILLFVPHLQWGGWIVLASTILITASGVVTCAMRRTLVSRKARKKRIAENAEMSGENFYNRQNDELKFTSPPPLMDEPKTPMVNGAPGADGLPSFATFDAARGATGDDERRPLNQRVPSNKTSATAFESRDDGSDRYGPPRSRSRGRYYGPRDEFGNPLPPSNAFGPSASSSPVERREPSIPTLPDQLPLDRSGLQAAPREGSYGQSRRRGGYPTRGGYAPRGGGYGGLRDQPPQPISGRGGYSAESRAGHGTRGEGGYPVEAAAMGGAAVAVAGEMAGRGHRGPPPNYPREGENVVQSQYSQPHNLQEIPPTQGYGRPPTDQYVAYGARQASPGGTMRSRSPYSARQPSPAGGLRNRSPPPPMPNMPGPMDPVGQAVGMDAAGGMDPHYRSAYGPQGNQIRDSDADVQGMVGLQQSRQDFPREQGNILSPTSAYSPEEYIPPRRAWTARSHSGHSTPRGNPNQGLPASPVEMPTTHNMVTAHSSNRARINSGSSDVYYEDVSPRFAAESDPTPLTQSSAALPPSLTPGQSQSQSQNQNQSQSQSQRVEPFVQTASYEDLQQGARSPAESEASNFTSVSQRGVNPNWRPGGPGDVGHYPAHVMRKPLQQQQKRDMILGNNPDFELPIPRPQRGRAGMMGGPSGRMPGPTSTFGGSNGGRYPGAEI